MMMMREKNGLDKKSPKREAEPKKTFRVSVHIFRVLNVFFFLSEKVPLLSRQRSLSSFLRRFCFFFFFFFFFFFVFAGLEIIFVSALRQSDDDDDKRLCGRRDDDAPLKERRQKRLNRFAERETKKKKREECEADVMAVNSVRR